MYIIDSNMYEDPKTSRLYRNNIYGKTKANELFSRLPQVLN